MITKIEGTCQFRGCTAKATHIACGDGEKAKGFHPVPACYCMDHALKVVHEDGKYSTGKCPNCGCVHAKP